MTLDGCHLGGNASALDNCSLITATDDVQPDVHEHPAVYLVLTGCFLLLLTIWTVLGNLLVFIAMGKYRSLRTISNYLILNMAASDFLLAVTVLPFSIASDLLDYWIFGEVLCKMWLAVDVLYCTASIWNIVTVAFDRFTATSFPLWYRERRSHVMAAAYIIGVWTLSTLISVPPMLTNEKFNSTYVYEPASGRHQCILYNQLEYVIFSSLGSFVLPMLIIVALYSRIFCVLHAQSQHFTKVPGLTPKSTPLAPIGNKPYEQNRDEASHTETGNTLRSPSREDGLSACLIDAASPSTATNCMSLDVARPPVAGAKRKQTLGVTKPADCGSLESMLTGESSGDTRDDPGCKGRPPGRTDGGIAFTSSRILIAVVTRMKPTRRNSLKRFARREKEATKRVTVLVVLFVVSWMPFMIMYMYRGFSGNDVNEHLQKLVIWLGYANSALNPCLYIWQNRELRKAYAKILHAPTRTCHKP